MEREIELWRYLRKKFGHVSVERVLSGPGLVNVYSWLRDSGRFEEPLWLKALMKEGDPAKAISEKRARVVMDFFMMTSFRCSSSVPRWKRARK